MRTPVRAEERSDETSEDPKDPQLNPGFEGRNRAAFGSVFVGVGPKEA